MSILFIYANTCVSFWYKYGFEESSDIPNIIWTYWHDDNLPKIVNKCIDQWKKHNPSFTINVVTKNNINIYFPDFDIKSIRHNDSHARFSDYVRLNLLSKYGGIWMDATVVCKISWNWIHAYQKNEKTQVIVYYYNNHNGNNNKQLLKTPIVESWFIACIPNSIVINEWLIEFNRMNDFATVDYYIQDIINKNTDLSLITNNLLNYFAVYVSLQYVMQHKLKNINNYITFLDATNGPYKYLFETNWNTKQSINKICNINASNSPIIKIVNAGRKFIENNFELCEKTLFAL